MKGEDQPLHKIFTQWVPGSLKPFWTKPRPGRYFSTWVFEATDGKPRAPVAQQTHGHIMLTAILLALSFLGTALSRDIESGILRPMLDTPPIRTMPQGLMIDYDDREALTVNSRRVTVLDGSHPPDSDLEYVIVGQGGGGNDVLTSQLGSTAHTFFDSDAGSAGLEEAVKREEGIMSAVDGGAKIARASVPSIKRRAQEATRRRDSTDRSDEGDGTATESSEDGGEEEDSSISHDGDTSSEEMLVIIAIVVGCGVLTLVILCAVRKVMDLCLLRYDPTGSISYSQEEGLPKATIERLPHTRYKKPPQPVKAQVKAAKVGSKKEGFSSSGAAGSAVAEEGAAEDVLENGGQEGVMTDIAPVAPESTAAAGARDSTEDMCAICLIEYEHGDELRIIPGCKHQFHKDCIDPWLETKAVCAYCKAKVEARKSWCDRVVRFMSDRLGIRLVAPTTVRFSSSRRTYTNRDVNEAMGPNLPPAYGRSDVDYVGSMVGTMIDSRPGGNGEDEETGGAEGRRGAGSGSGSGTLRAVSIRRGGSMREETAAGAAGGEQGGNEPHGTIVVQPVAGSSFVVVPRDFSTGGTGANVGSINNEDVSASTPAASIVARASEMVAVGGGGECEEKRGDVEHSRGSSRGTGSRSRGRARSARGSNSRVGGGVRDGLGGVVFGGNTEEFKEAETENRERLEKARADSGNSCQVTL